MTGYVEEFILAKENLSVLSKKEYKKTVSLLYEYIDENKFKKINKRIIESFIIYLENENYKVASINKYISIINNYLFYLFENGYIDNVIKVKHLKNALKENRTIISYDEFDKLIHLIESNFDNTERNILILCFLFFTELKLNEILLLKENNFYDDFQFLKIKSKDISLNIEIMKYLKNYSCKKNDYLFKNKNGNKLSRQSVWKFIKLYNEKLSINLSIDILNKSYKINKLLRIYK